MTPREWFACSSIYGKIIYLKKKKDTKTNNPTNYRDAHWKQMWFKLFQPQCHLQAYTSTTSSKMSKCFPTQELTFILENGSCIFILKSKWDTEVAPNHVDQASFIRKLTLRLVKLTLLLPQKDYLIKAEEVTMQFCIKKTTFLQKHLVQLCLLKWELIGQNRRNIEMLYESTVLVFLNSSQLRVCAPQSANNLTWWKTPPHLWAWTKKYLVNLPCCQAY